MTGGIDVIVEDPAWDGAGADWPRVADGLHARVLSHLEDARRDGAALLLADDAALARLNARFRGRDYPTNVLSFPAPAGADSLGDIAIAYGVCAREAAEQGKSFADHAAHLILHGLLHLHGFDHETGEADAEAMESLERDILAEIGIADPYDTPREAQGARAHHG